jgi:hypothetical protein
VVSLQGFSYYESNTGEKNSWKTTFVKDIRGCKGSGMSADIEEMGGGGKEVGEDGAR